MINLLKGVTTRFVLAKFPILVSSGLLLLICSSCDGFVEVDAPNSQLIGNTVFNDRSTANAAISDIYRKMRDSGLLTGQASGITCRLGLYADELDFYQDIGANPFYTNSLSAGDPGVKDLWDSSYNAIYAANAIAEGISQSVLDQSDKDLFTGEVLFIRAIMHFYLVNLYGDIPYITSTDYSVNSSVPKVTQQQVYDAIIGDLNRAIQLLPQDDLTGERVRPYKAAATALLARAYLYSQQWGEASQAASAVLNNPAFVLESDLDNIFLNTSPGTIWQFSPAGAGNNTHEADLFIFSEGPPPVVALTPAMVNAFDPADRRRQHWIKEVTDGSTVWCHPYKYKTRAVAGSSTEYSIVLRISEMYLIRAEARAKQGDLDGALEDLNKIRTNAGLLPSEANSQQTILTAVLQERHLELFTEFGHRFFDLKRYGQLQNILSLSKPGWDMNDTLWPIPGQELLSNPNLNPQNPGY
jgi:hypothetical protein